MKLEFKHQTRDELKPFMTAAFKKSLEPSLICEIDDIAGENSGYSELKKNLFASQKRLDLGLYVDDKQVGSFMGRHIEKGIFRMGTSVILPEYQGQGFYSQLLEYVESWVKEEGMWAIDSQHNPCNSKIISMKLQKGFFIAGMETTMHIGNVVKLIKFLDKKHEDMFKFRNGFIHPNEYAKRLLELK